MMKQKIQMSCGDSLPADEIVSAYQSLRAGKRTTHAGGRPRTRGRLAGVAAESMQRVMPAKLGMSVKGKETVMNPYQDFKNLMVRGGLTTDDLSDISLRTKDGFKSKEANDEMLARIKHAEVIWGHDIKTHNVFLLFGRTVMQNIVNLNQTRQIRPLLMNMRQETEELEMAVAAIQVAKGYDEYIATEDDKPDPDVAELERLLSLDETITTSCTTYIIPDPPDDD